MSMKSDIAKINQDASFIREIADEIVSTASRPRGILVDPRSYELAEYFLSEPRASRDRTMSLAQAIQQSVEDWFEENAEATRG